MMYVLVGLGVVCVIVGVIMIRLWSNYYSDRGQCSIYEDDEIERLGAMCEDLGGHRQLIHQRDLFQGKVIWCKGDQDRLDWTLELGAFKEHAYCRWRATFESPLGQGMSFEKGRGTRSKIEQGSGTVQQLSLKHVDFSPMELPGHLLCRARDEERARDFVSGARRKRLLALERRVHGLYLDDRQIYLQCDALPEVDVLGQLLKDAIALTQVLIDWSGEKGTISALETGQYQGALAELEQAGLRDTAALEEPESLEGEEAPEELQRESSAEGHPR